MILFVMFLNLFAVCESKVDYVKVLDHTSQNMISTTEYYVKGKMNIDGVKYNTFYITNDVCYNTQLCHDIGMFMHISTPDNKFGKYCRARTFLQDFDDFDREIRNCLCEYTGLYYFWERTMEALGNSNYGNMPR